MFQILESQSRYELQQQLLLNPNGLENNSTNRFGSVDGLGNTSSIISVSHPNFGEAVQQGSLVSQPNLIIDHFGTGKNAILFNGTTDYLIKTNTSFTPDWDEEFWIAGKFKSNGSTFRAMMSIGEGSINTYGFRSQFASERFAFVIRVQNLNIKNLITTTTYNDNLEHTYIVHWKGTNVVSDSDIYMDGVLESTTSSRDESFIGSSLYSAADVNIYFGGRQDVNALWNQYLGKHILGLGTPNVEVITNSLNSVV